jgi:predicted nucleotidyltransferase
MAGNGLTVKENERLALEALKTRIQALTDINKIIVFGSVARGEATEESDLDVLVVTETPMSYKDETAIFDITFFVNMEHDTNISVVVTPKEKWSSPVWSLLPLYQAIDREGIAV